MIWEFDPYYATSQFWLRVVTACSLAILYSRLSFVSFGKSPRDPYPRDPYNRSDPPEIPPDLADDYYPLSSQGRSGKVG